MKWHWRLIYAKIEMCVISLLISSRRKTAWVLGKFYGFRMNLGFRMEFTHFFENANFHNTHFIVDDQLVYPRGNEPVKHSNGIDSSISERVMHTHWTISDEYILLWRMQSNSKISRAHHSVRWWWWINQDEYVGKRFYTYAAGPVSWSGLDQMRNLIDLHLSNKKWIQIKKVYDSNFTMVCGYWFSPRLKSSHKIRVHTIYIRLPLE